jgi:ribosome biogenesis GTPase
MLHTGRIIELRKKTCLVDTDRGVFDAAFRGTLAKRERPLAGDVVDIQESGGGGEAAYAVIGLHPRTSQLRRPAIANVNQLLCIFSFCDPPLDCGAVDRCLVSAEANDLRCAIVFNKTDLLDDEERAAQAETVGIYERIGYPVLVTSAATGENMDALLSRCAGRLTCLAGPSGAGKTSILAALFPGRQFRTAEISPGSGRGTHTTTGTTLITLPGGGYIADTPGFSVLDMPELTDEGVTECFPELAAHTGGCRFNNCAHVNEPGCTVRAMVDNGEIAASRYESYLRARDEVRAANRNFG